MMSATILFEYLFFLLFVSHLVYFFKRSNFRAIFELLSISAFALSLEFLSIHLYEAYSYSTKFILQFGSSPDNVPIVIALCWGMIIYSSIEISNAFNLNTLIKPFLDSLMALTVDFSMDAVAIRTEGGFWTWDNILDNSITSTSFVGVKYGNFIGWYLIVLIYSYFIRFGRVKLKLFDKKLFFYLLFVPAIALIPFYLLFEFFQLAGDIMAFSGSFALIVLFLVVLALFLVINDYRNNNREFEKITETRLAMSIHFSFHIFFLTLLLVGKFYILAPHLLFITS